MNIANRHGTLRWKTSLPCLFASSVVIVLTADAQSPNVTAGPELASILNFEMEQTGTMPRGWGGGPPGTIFIDEAIVRAGRRSAGKRHWDYELFRVTPKVLAAQSRDSANTAVLNWLRALGDIADCKNCAAPRDQDLHYDLQLAWLNDEAALGPDLTKLLRSIYRNRSKGPKFYISKNANAGNPLFENELPYPNVRFPDAGYQLLGLYRYWNVIEYWYPNRNILDEDWDKVLKEFIPRIAGAKDKDAYELEMMRVLPG
jgi:hypothetical protein